MSKVLALFIGGVGFFLLFFVFLFPFQSNPLSEAITDQTFSDLSPVGCVDDYVHVSTAKGGICVPPDIPDIPDVPASDQNNQYEPQANNGKSIITIETQCNTLFPNGFSIDLKQEYLQSDIDPLGCFPIENIDVEKCETRELLDGNPVQKCFASGGFEESIGTSSAIQGEGFLDLWCDMGSTWAQCHQDNIFPVLSFLS